MVDRPSKAARPEALGGDHHSAKGRKVGRLGGDNRWQPEPPSEYWPNGRGPKRAVGTPVRSKRTYATRSQVGTGRGTVLVRACVKLAGAMQRIPLLVEPALANHAPCRLFAGQPSPLVTKRTHVAFR